MICALSLGKKKLNLLHMQKSLHLPLFQFILFYYKVDQDTKTLIESSSRLVAMESMVWASNWTIIKSFPKNWPCNLTDFLSYLLISSNLFPHQLVTYKNVCIYSQEHRALGHLHEMIRPRLSCRPLSSTFSGRVKDQFFILLSSDELDVLLVSVACFMRLTIHASQISSDYFG